jgi:hypothetical protein
MLQAAAVGQSVSIFPTSNAQYEEPRATGSLTAGSTGTLDGPEILPLRSGETSGTCDGVIG